MNPQPPGPEAGPTAAVVAQVAEAARAAPAGSEQGDVLRQALRDLAWVDLLRGARAKRERLASAMAHLATLQAEPDAER